jgi:dTDP-4-dehydrorhamnose 3,5-epimerase
MSFSRLSIPDVILVEAKAFPDNRGFFMECYKESAFKQYIPHRFVQDNLSHSKKNVLRGLHYQLRPKAQGKLVYVVRGEIYDVAVDIRKNSPTYSRWVSQVLSSENHKMLYVPEGFAHGFLVISDEADVVYKVTDEYSPQHERGILWNDSDLAIEWPAKEPLLSKKDSELPRLKEAENNFD